MTPEFRVALYEWSYPEYCRRVLEQREGAENVKEDQVSTFISENEKDSIVRQLQLLFVALQTEHSAQSTTLLTKSFGWTGSAAFTQHDVQELCRVLLDALESALKGTKQENLIADLYQGELEDYVTCVTCKTNRSRTDTFQDLSLVIKPFGSTRVVSSVQEALREFVKHETLEGDNQYHCMMCNAKKDAVKGLKISSLPLVLTLQLKRFDYDYQRDARIKLNHRVTFPDILDMNPFLAAAGEEDNIELEISIDEEEDDEKQSNGNASNSNGEEVREDDVEWEDGCINNNGDINFGNVNNSKNKRNLLSEWGDDEEEEETNDDMEEEKENQLSTTRKRKRPVDTNSTCRKKAKTAESSTTTSTTTANVKKKTANAKEDCSISLTPSDRNRKIEAALKNGPNVYELFAVLVHSGSAIAGHYYAYIWSFSHNSWFEFNDSSVYRISPGTVEKAFGENETLFSSYSSYSYSSYSGANAYMLVYRKVDRSRTMQEPIAAPTLLTDELQLLKEQRAVIKKQQDEAKNTLILTISYNGSEKTIKTRPYAYHTFNHTLLDQCIATFDLKIERENIKLVDQQGNPINHALYQDTTLILLTRENKYDAFPRLRSTKIRVFSPETKKWTKFSWTLDSSQKCRDFKESIAERAEMPAKSMLISDGEYVIEDNAKLGIRISSSKIWIEPLPEGAIEVTVEPVEAVAYKEYKKSHPRLRITLPDKSIWKQRVDKGTTYEQFKHVAAEHVNKTTDQFSMCKSSSNYWLSYSSKKLELKPSATMNEGTSSSRRRSDG